MPAPTFSQREGYHQLPSQLQLEEAPNEFRGAIAYSLSKELEKYSYISGGLDKSWSPVAKEIQIQLYGIRPSQVIVSRGDFYFFLENKIYTSKFNELFDLLEFLLSHKKVSQLFKLSIIQAFKEYRLAYRVIGEGRIGAVGTELQAQTFLNAVSELQSVNAHGAYAHLVNASTEITAGNWAGSVRESIHAVESVAKSLSSKGTLGSVMQDLLSKKYVNKCFSAAVEKLYAYTNSEGGVRHALIFDKAEADIDEYEALFFLGACSALIPYLLSKSSGLKASEE